ncbi:MAG: thioredoxin domain-containing protein, partial [Asticcacaulis sp.]|nr:thioredoxin domain-containing protein [Asticcacaulis sp.]
QEQFEACVTSVDNIDRMDRMNQAYIKTDGIQGTPTFVVNGRELPETPHTIDDFDAILQPLLK